MRLRWLLLGLLVTALLVPAVLLTAARLLEPAGGTWVRLVAFTPFGVVLYAAAVLVLLLACFGDPSYWRAAARSLTVVALVGVLVHAFWASGPYVGGPSAEAAGSGSLRVMTSNLRLGEADTAAVVEAAVHDKVDVLVLEEVTPWALAHLRAAGLYQAFDHAAGRPAPGPAGTMVFSSYRLAKVRRLDTGFASYRMVLRTPGGPTTLLAVHPRPPIGSAESWRADQAVLRTAARSVTGPAVVAGDLNATMDHAPMRELVGRGYRDAATQAKSRWQPTWPAAGEVSRFGFPVPSMLAIDHVLTRGGPHAVRTRTVTITGSDHRALVADLRR